MMESLVRILHLEDDPLDTELVKQHLRHDGLAVEIHRVAAAAAFKRALEHQQYALVLSDYTIPGTDTRALLGWARQQIPEVPYVFFSGTMGEDLGIELLKLGASDYVLKQRIERLAPAVRRALQEREEQLRRKEAEEKRRISEDRYRSLIQASAQAVWVATPAGEIIEDSPSWRAITGQSFEQFRGYGWLEALHPEDRQRAAEAWRKAVETRSIYETEYRVRNAAGECRHMIARGVPVLNEDGSIREWVGMNVDVTEQRQAQESLRRSEQVLRFAQQAGSIGAFEWNAQTGVSTWTPQMEAMHGLAPGHYGGRKENWEEFVHPDDRAAAAALVDQAIATGEPVEGEWRVVWPDGSVHWILGRMQAFKEAEGRPLRLSGINIDITARRRAEAALAEARRRLDSALIAGEVGTFEWDVVGDRLRGDQNFAHIFSIKLDRTGAAPLSDYLAAIHPDDRQRVLTRIEHTLDTGGDYEAEYRITSGGQTRWVIARGKVERDATGRPIRFPGVVLDVTTRRRAEEELASVAQFPAENPDPVLRLDPEGRVLYANPASTALLLERDGWHHGDPAPVELRNPAITALHTGRPGEFEFVCRDHRVMAFLCVPVPDKGYANLYGRDVTEVRKAHEGLRKSEQRLRATFNNAALGIVEVTRDDRIVEVNERLCQMLDYRREDLIGRTIHELTAAEDREQSDQLNAQVHEGTDNRVEYEKRYLKRDGTPLWVRVAVNAMRDPNGRWIGSIGTVEDISQRKRTEAELAAARRRLESALIAGEVGTFEWDIVGERVGGDSNFERMFGVALDEHGAAPLADYVAVMHPDDQERVRKRIALTVETGVDYEIEYRVVSGGRTRWLLVRARPERDASGRVVRAAGVCLDVTERKQAEEALRESEARHRVLAEELQAVMDATPGGICVAHDPQCHLITGNRVAHELFGIPTEENISATPPEQDASPYFRIYHHGREMPGAEMPMQVAAATGAIVRDVELEAVRRDGTRRVFLINAAPLRSPDGTVRGSVGAFTDITERKQAEEALHESELFYRQTLESIPGMVFTTRPDGYCDYQSQQWVEYTGVPMSEHLGDGWNKLLHPEDRPRAHAAWRAAVEGTAPYDLEYRVRRHDGQYEWFKVIGRPIRDASGQIVRWFGIALNIEDLKRAEEALRASEARYRTLFNEIDEGFCIIEMLYASGRPNDWRFVEVNPAFERHNGLKQATGKTIRELAPEIEPYWFERYGEVARTGQADRFVEFSQALGRWFDLYAFRVGEPEQHRVAVLFTDITARRRTEEALSQSEERFRVAQELSPDGFAVFRPVRDAQGRVVDFIFIYENDAIGRMNGTDPKAVVGRRLLEVLPRHGETPFHRLHQEVAETGQPRVLEALYEADNLPSKFWFRVVVVPIAGDIAIHAQDITERKRAEEALAAATRSAERAKAAAEEASRAKDQFLAVLSHELRTPLTPVVTAVSMLQKQWRCDQASRETLEMIRRNVEMEARLIDDLLDVTRIVRGKIELDRRPVPLCEVLHRAVEVCKPDIEARRLHFGVDIGPSAPYLIHADAARLQQVFWNLLKNAIKFTPHGGCVGIRCRLDDYSVVAEVMDSGEGIDPTLLPHIFNPFEQGGTRVTQQFGGLGLGLTITKGLVEMHGGTISAHSEGKGKGATFRVRLPIHRNVESSRPSTEPEANAAGAARSSAAVEPQSLRILLVEDHGDTARIMRRLLMAEGHEVAMAGDVATALELAESKPFDLLLSDLGLPDGSGVDLMRELRRRGHTLRGIALSGYGQEEDIRRSKEAGFAEHLTKPTSPDRLAEAIAVVSSQTSQERVAIGDRNGGRY